MNHDIFISYSSKQKNIADGVCHYLEENGLKCWMAPRDIQGGHKYGDCIYDAIVNCKVFVLVFSEAASLSPWVNGEIHRAFSNNKPIVPFRIDETQVTGDLDLMLNSFHWIDAFPNYADRLPDLLKSICGLLGRPENHPEKTGSINNLEYVDLGLPSGTLWATCNVGANKPEDYGDYFSWEEGNKASAKRGDGWSMPTKEQWEELMQNAENIWITRNGVKGRLFAAHNGETLFLPAAGYRIDGCPFNMGGYGLYWSSSLCKDLPGYAWDLYFFSDNCLMYDYYCSRGVSVRLVRSAREN